MKPPEKPTATGRGARGVRGGHAGRDSERREPTGANDPHAAGDGPTRLRGIGPTALPGGLHGANGPTGPTGQGEDGRHVLLGRIVRRGLDRSYEAPGETGWAERAYRQARAPRPPGRAWPIALTSFGAACAGAALLLAWLRPGTDAEDRPLVFVAEGPHGAASHGGAPATTTAAAGALVMAGDVLRFSEGSVVTFLSGAAAGVGQVTATSPTGAELALIDGRARFRLTPRKDARWVVQAGPYQLTSEGGAFEAAWTSKQDVLSVGLYAGRVQITGPGAAGGRALHAGESLIARARDGLVTTGAASVLAAALRPEEATEGVAEALVAVDESEGERFGGWAGPDPSGTPAPVATGPAPDENGVCPARESTAASFVPDPGPVSLATCSHVDPGPSGRDVQARITSEPWVRATAGGCLRYTEDARGNRIPDFSQTGYHGGGVPLPAVAATAGVTPLSPSSSGDDTAAIQAAIDAASELPVDSRGFRGVVELGPGTFTLRGSLRLAKGGVILRGQASEGPNATVLRGVGAPRTLIRIGGTGRRRSGRQTLHVTDAYVPVGARSFSLERTGNLRVGDEIIVWRPKTQRWICAIGLDVLPSAGDGQANPPWRPTGAFTFERRITRIEGNRITVDAPLTNALEKDFTQAYVTEMEFPERISEVGVERLAARGEFTTAGKCPSPRSKLVRADAIANAWVRDVRAENLGGEVASLGSGSKWVTVEDATWVGLAQPQGQGQSDGSASDARCPNQTAFTVGGQQNLIYRSRSLGSNVNAFMSETEVEGPNAVVDFLAVGRAARVRVAARWSSGFLFDNVRLQDGAGHPTGDFDLGRGRDTFGWSAANSVLWNSEAEAVSVDSPPTAYNWFLGGNGRNLQGTGVFASPRAPLQPASLYRAQLVERLGRGALYALGRGTASVLPSSLTGSLPGPGTSTGAIDVADQAATERLPERTP